MEEVKKASAWLYKFFLLFSIPWFLEGAIMFSIMGGNSWVFFISAPLILAEGLFFKLVDVLNRRKLERLKEDGLCIDVPITKIIPYYWIKIGNGFNRYITAKVECLYKTERESRTIKSGFYLLTPFDDKKENLFARAYFSREDSEKYSIVLFRKKS